MGTPHSQLGSSPLLIELEKSTHSNEDPVQPNINKQNKNFIKKEKQDSTIRPEIVKHLEEYIGENSLPLVYVTFFKIWQQKQK